MPKEINGEEDIRPIKIFGILLPSLPSLIFRFGGTFLRYKKSAQRAGKVFKKELIKQGLDKETADELTEEYLEASHFSNFIQGFH